MRLSSLRRAILSRHGAHLHSEPKCSNLQAVGRKEQKETLLELENFLPKYAKYLNQVLLRTSSLSLVIVCFVLQLSSLLLSTFIMAIAPPGLPLLLGGACLIFQFSTSHMRSQSDFYCTCAVCIMDQHKNIGAF